MYCWISIHKKSPYDYTIPYKKRQLNRKVLSNSRWVQRQLLPIYILRSAEPMLGMEGEARSLAPPCDPPWRREFSAKIIFFYEKFLQYLIHLNSLRQNLF